MRKDKGIALIVLVIIILLAGILFPIIISYTQPTLSLVSLRLAERRALYAANAGFYEYVTRYWARDVMGDSFYQLTWPGAYYSVYGDASVLGVDASKGLPLGISPAPSPNNLYVYLYNFNYQTAIRVDRIKIEWWNNLADANLRLNKINLNGTDFNAGNADSGVEITVNSVLTAIGGIWYPTSTYTTMTLFFSGILDLKNAIVVGTFYLSDGSERKAVLFNKGRSGNNDLSVTVVGEARGGISSKRTLRFTYDPEVKDSPSSSTKGKITSVEEVRNPI